MVLSGRQSLDIEGFGLRLEVERNLAGPHELVSTRADSGGETSITGELDAGRVTVDLRFLLGEDGSDTGGGKACLPKGRYYPGLKRMRGRGRSLVGDQGEVKDLEGLAPIRRRSSGDREVTEYAEVSSLAEFIEAQ